MQSNQPRSIRIDQPGQIYVGNGEASKTGAWAAAKGYSRILVLTSRSNASLVEQLMLPGNVMVFSDVHPEPEDTVLDAALLQARQHRPDLVIGLGGGSVMDIAKLVVALWDSEQQLVDVVGPDRVEKKCSALALLPTTAGTGSEAGIRALVTSSASKQKMAIESPLMSADFVVLDASLTCSVPADITAATGIDAMAHCVEAFTSLRSHDMIDGYARMGIALVGRYLARAVKEGSDTEAREGMMLASYYGGVCLGPVNTAAGHALAYPLGSYLGLPHGLANALIFPHVLAYNATVCESKTAEVLVALKLSGDGSAQSIRDSCRAFCAELGIDMALSAHGAQSADLAQWAVEAHSIRRLMDNNPREMEVEDVLAIYKAAL